MKKRYATWFLAAAAAVSLCGAAVWAAEPGAEPAGAEQDETLTVQIAAAPAPEAAADTAAAMPQETKEAASPEEAVPAYEPDPEGTVIFGSIERRVREHNLNCLILQESIDSIEITDYEDMEEKLRKGLNGLADAQWSMVSMGTYLPSTGDAAVDAAIQGAVSISGSIASQSLSAQYEALRQQYDDLRDGKIQKDMADAVRQLKNTQDSLVMATEGLFAQLKELDAADATMGRKLTALDRQIEEMELRYKLGQISSLTLKQVQAGRTALVSARQTLRSNVGTAKMNLASLLGEDVTRTLTLGALPRVTADQLNKMDLEKDLAAAKAASYKLYDAKKTLDDAKEDYNDAGGDANIDSTRTKYLQARHTWQAAQYTYEAAVQSYELSFRTLYNQIGDYRQVLNAARSALAIEQVNYSVSQLKYEQGTISKNTLLAAKDKVSDAQDSVDTAARNLFTAYNNYCWAVETGILN